MSRRRSSTSQIVTCDSEHRYYPPINFAGSVVTSGSGGTTLIKQTNINNVVTLKELLAGPGILLTTAPGTITVTNTQSSSAWTMTDDPAGIGMSIINDGIGPDVAFKGLTAGSDIALVEHPDGYIRIENTAVGEGHMGVFDAAGGTGASIIVAPHFGNNAQLGTLNAGTNISIAGGGTANLTITNTLGGGGAVTLSNAGGGTSLITDGTGPTLAVVSMASSPNSSTTLNVTGGVIRLSTPGIITTDASSNKPGQATTATTAGGLRCTAIGENAVFTAGSDGVIVGASGTVGSDNNTTVGFNVAAPGLGPNCTVIGTSSTSGDGGNCIVIGTNCSTDVHRSVVIGYSDGVAPLTTTFTDSVTIGQNIGGVQSTYFGQTRSAAFYNFLYHQTHVVFSSTDSTLIAHNFSAISNIVYYMNSPSTHSLIIGSTTTMLANSNLLDSALTEDTILRENGGEFWVGNATSSSLTIFLNSGWTIFDTKLVAVGNNFVTVPDNAMHRFVWRHDTGTNFQLLYAGKYKTIDSDTEDPFSDEAIFG